MLKKISNVIWVLTAFSLLFASCEKEGDSPTRFGIFTILDDNTTIEMNGVINGKSLNKFNDLIDVYPTVNRINIKECEGSSNDEVNLELAKKVYDREMEIHLMDNGLIASGGTDFFLAGRTRTKGENTQIGVHSWSGGSKEATDFPEGHENHLPYIEYYVSIGFTQEQAEEFYYFTINAAPANSIHWMTEQEIEQYNILSD